MDPKRLKAMLAMLERLTALEGGEDSVGLPNGLHIHIHTGQAPVTDFETDAHPQVSGHPRPWTS